MKLFQLIYSKKYRDEGLSRWHLRHCVIEKIAEGKPRNCLVRLKGGTKLVVPWGNLKHVGNLKLRRC